MMFLHHIRKTKDNVRCLAVFGKPPTMSVAVYLFMLEKKLVFTAHNINAGQRDRSESILNQVTLRFRHKVVKDISVHTNLMKKEFVKDFNVKNKKLTVIPSGTNDYIPESELTRKDARETLGLSEDEKYILFFARIAFYKGLEDLVMAPRRIRRD